MTEVVPVSRSLAAVLLDLFAGPDDAVRLLIVPGVKNPAGTPGGTDHTVWVNINGQVVKLPCLASSVVGSNCGSDWINGRPIVVLATRTQLIVLDTPYIPGD